MHKSYTIIESRPVAGTQPDWTNSISVFHLYIEHSFHLTESWELIDSTILDLFSLETIRDSNEQIAHNKTNFVASITDCTLIAVEHSDIAIS